METIKSLYETLALAYEQQKADYLRRRIITDDKLLGVTAVCEITGLSRTHIYRLAERGELAYMECAGVKKFKESDIAAMIIEHPKTA